MFVRGGFPRTQALHVVSRAPSISNLSNRSRSLARLPMQSTRGIVIQRRYLLGPLFRMARSGFSLAAGATAGGAAYANYKLNQASSSAQEAVGQAKDWLGSVWDRLPQLPDLSQASNRPGSGPDTSSVNDSGSSSAATGGGNGSGTGTEAGAGTSAEGGGSGASGGSGGSGGELGAAIPLASSAADLDDEEVLDDPGEQGMINLTRKMIEIRSILVQIDGAGGLQLPSIVVIGSQSSGKSSVLEAVVGHEFLPKGSNMVTRRPIELTLVNTPQGQSEHCEFPALRQTHITDFRDVQRLLTDMNKAVPIHEVVSEEPIQLRIYSPHVPDLTLIDLPGYIQVVAADQPLELKQRIAQLCEKYIQPPNVILAVSAADVDLANSAALNASRRVDPRGERTIGVITKMDLVDPQRGRATLLNREYPLKMGYVGVVTHYTSPLFTTASNLTSTIAKSERGYFDNAEFSGLDVGVLRLRSKLMKTLEASMASSLEPTTRTIRRELEETAYQFKVQYNDRVLTPQTYLARSADAFKIGFQEMAAEFGRDQIRELIKRDLDQKVLDLLAERYWNAPPNVEKLEGDISLEFGNLDKSTGKSDVFLWQTRVDQASASLTKLGIGRLSAQLLVDAVTERMVALTNRTAFQNHPLAVDVIEEATQSLLSSRFYSTADQVENSIKPYKYEVDMDAREWSRAREHSYNLLKEELRQCEQAFALLGQELGRSKLMRLMKSVDRQDVTSLAHFSTTVVDQARLALFLRDRCDLLRARIAFVRSAKCQSRKNRAVCPEVFLDAVADKLTSTAVLFLNFELLSDFYYSFPRELDAKLGSLTEQQVEILATQDPRIKRHVELQRRRELLQLALNKLQTVTEMRATAISAPGP